MLHVPLGGGLTQLSITPGGRWACMQPHLKMHVILILALIARVSAPVGASLCLGLLHCSFIVVLSVYSTVKYSAVPCHIHQSLILHSHFTPSLRRSERKTLYVVTVMAQDG